MPRNMLHCDRRELWVIRQQRRRRLIDLGQIVRIGANDGSTLVGNGDQIAVIVDDQTAGTIHTAVR